MNKLGLILKGAAMGVAEVIPGVSGGTIAFITGIYERLLHCIKAIDPSLLKIWKEGGLSGVWKAIDGVFLTTLLVGMVSGLVVGVFAIIHLLEAYPSPLWGFFFGLILASSIYIGRQITGWTVAKWTCLIAGLIIAYTITIISPVEGSNHPLMIFIAGVIAISALILPGISGSFILLLMGMYTIVIPAVKHLLQFRDMESLWIVMIFASGCIVGLMTFSRVLSWLFAHYKEMTFALLTGFMLGSLNKIWPWRNVTEILTKETGETSKVLDPSSLASIDSETFKILSEANVLPQAYQMGDPYIFVTIGALVLGFLSVFLLERTQSKSL